MYSAPKLELDSVTSSWGAKMEVGGLRSGEGVTFSAMSREWIGIAGHNGIGKSTLLKALAGVAPFTEGVIKINGAHLPHRDISWRFLAGVMTIGQSPALPAVRHSLDDAKAVAFANRPGLFNERALAAAIAAFHQAGFIKRDDDLSPRLFEFAVSIMSVPSILLMDEIVVDHVIHGREDDFYQLVKKLAPAAIVLFTDHNVERMLRHASRVIWLRDCKPPEIINSLDHAATDTLRAEMLHDGQIAAELIDEEMWMQLAAPEGRPMAQIRLALQSQRRFRGEKGRQVERLCCELFPFLPRTPTALQLSGGERIILVRLIAAIAGIGPFPNGLLKSLDRVRQADVARILEAMKS